MPPAHLSIPKRPFVNTLLLVALWIAFYASFTLFAPALLDDADSVHAEVAREMLLRHDYITLYANGIRYLEKAPLLYWSMAASFKLFGVSTAAARVPLALSVLALAFAVEAFARRAFRSTRAGVYAALILLSSPALFLFTRITLPDAMLCLWLTLALLAFSLTEETIFVDEAVILTLNEVKGKDPDKSHITAAARLFLPQTLLLSSPLPNSGLPSSLLRLLSYAFAACCALGVLTKGLIGALFPTTIVLVYLLATCGWTATITRIRQLHPFSSLAVFLAIAAPWHVLIALANPTQGHPGGLTLLHGHLAVPLPTDGNVHGWLWFYFVNEQLLRYLNLRVPRDYDTVPLYLFWSLCLVWLAPWSAFAFKAIAQAARIISNQLSTRWLKDFHKAPPDASSIRPASANLLDARSTSADQPLGNHTSANGATLYQPGATPQEPDTVKSERAEGPTYLLLWAAIPMLFFSFSTRQEYYVLPALPAIAILIAGWLAQDRDWNPITPPAKKIRRDNLRITAALVSLGAIFSVAALAFLLHTHTPAPNADLAQLLQQNPADYALSMGHFLDLNAAALSLFRLPLALAAAALLLGPLASYFLRLRNRPHAATLALAAGAFGFLLAAHLGLQTFSPVLSSQQLAATLAPQLHPDDLIVIHQEYEFASTLAFYLRRPGYIKQNGKPVATNPIHILEGRSSNLWYGSFFPDVPAIFETPQTLAQKWPGPQRIFLWQDLADQPSPLPLLPTRVYVIAESGGKEILSNQPNHP